MEEPVWSQVLDAMYRHGKTIDAPRDLENLSFDHILVQKTDAEVDEISSALVFLRNQDLVTMAVSGQSDGEEMHRPLHLTTDGFEVAHQRDLNYQSKAGNRAIVALTVILGLGAILEAMIAWVTANTSDYRVGIAGLAIAMVAGILALVLYELKRAGAVQIKDLQRRRDRRLR